MAIFMAMSGLSFSQTECHTADTPPPLMLGPTLGCANTSNSASVNNEEYIPQPNDPIKTVRVVMHIMQKSDGSDNFQENVPADIAYLNAMFGPLGGPNHPNINTHFGVNPEPLYGGPTGNPYTSDSRIRFQLEGIYFHQDDIGWRNNNSDCGTYCLNNYGIETCRYLNIFIIGTTNLNNTNVRGCGPGLSSESNNCVVMQSMYADYLNHPPGNPWPAGPLGGDVNKVNNLVAHEIGHCLGLHHSFSSCSQFPDMDCPQVTYWCGPNSDYQCSNNMMGYSNTKRHLTDLQMGHVHQLLSSSWRSKLLTACERDPAQDVVITSNEVWEYAKVMGGDLTIEPGATLTIKCKVNMPEDGRIIVKPNARLIVDGGYITSNCCGAFWAGIQAWGATTQHQYPATHPSYQGLVVLKNNAYIEHARNLFTNWKPNDWNSIGGAIQATDVTFRNCRRSAEFMAYQNYLPGNPNSLRGNISRFTRCQFVVDDDYRGGDDFYAHASLWKVDGIDFVGCEFENLQTTIDESAYLGAGIVSIDAAYRVIPDCDIIVQGLCPPQHTVRSVFRGLDHGIRAGNSETSRRFVVDRADFHANIAGVYANGVPGYQVKNCRFFMGDRDVTLSGPVDTEFNLHHRGVFSTESWAFLVDDNELEQDGEHALTEGIVIGYSRDHNDVVFRNKATGLGVGYIGEGVCADLTPSGTPIRGLWFLCNENDGNTMNFWSRKINGYWDESSHTIRTNQGASKRPADNTFDQNAANGPSSDFHVTTTFSPIGYWHRNTGNYVPVHYSTGLFPAVATYIPPNNCAGKIGKVPHDPGTSSSMPPGPYVDELLERKEAYADTRYLYEQLIDGGNTDAVLEEIQESWPQDAWTLRGYLLNRSPYLSTASLREMVQRGIMPDAMVTEILVANPEATRQDGFLRWLQEESGHALPEYLLGMVVASWDQRTYRDALENEMALHHGEMTQAANALLHHYRSDTAQVPLDSVRWVWRQLRTPAARFGEALAWLEEDRFDSAATAIAWIPEEHRLGADGLAEVQRMQEWIGFLQGVHGSGRTTLQLDSAEVQQLVALAGAAYDRPAAFISNLLCFGYGICRPPSTGGDDGTPKSLPRTELPSAGHLVQALLAIHPNPADAWVAFDYDLLVPPEDAVLVVRDVTGREVYRKALHEARQQVVWDTRMMAPGTYTASLIDRKQLLRSEKIVIRQ